MLNLEWQSLVLALPSPAPRPVFPSGAPACVDTGSDQRHYPDLLEPFAEQKVLCVHFSLSSESQFKNKNINIFITGGFYCREKEVLPLQRFPVVSGLRELSGESDTEGTENHVKSIKGETMLVRQ